MTARQDGLRPPRVWNLRAINCPNANSAYWPLAAIALILAFQFTLVFQRAINWDEFYHYSRVVMLAEGTLTLPLQTLYTRAFAWVVGLPGTGVDHVVLIRCFMFLSELVVLAAIVGMATRFSNRTAALLCALSYISAGFVYQHGFSFRFDPPAAALLMSALWILLRARLEFRTILAVGLLVGLAFMITIKAVLYAPAFAGIIWLRWNEQGRALSYLLKVALTGLCAAAAFGIIYWLHSYGLAAQSGTEAKRVIAESGGKMFSLGVQPYWKFAARGAVLSPLLALLILAFPAVAFFSRRDAKELVALIGLFLPISTLIFYHNTAPYYYTFMLPPVVVACAPALAMLARRYGVALWSFAFLASAVAIQAREYDSPIGKQRELLQAADQMFPEPVAYFDFCAMIGQFPKANIFMTPWGLEQYKKGLHPSMREVMARQPVPLVILNDPMFEKVFHSRRDVREFLPDDVAAMRSTYIPLWGPFWIAGLEIPAGAADHRFELLVPGPYTVQGSAVTVDGVTLRPGAIIELERGHHVARSSGSAARLIWGRNIRVPEMPAPPKPHFTPF